MDRPTDTVRPWTRDSLADHLESEVVTQGGQSGRALPSERSLSEKLGVSRSLVREVLRGLEQRGLVDILPGKGAYPRPPSTDEAARIIRRTCIADGVGADDLIEARIALEGRAASLAAPRCTPDTVTALALALADRGGSRDFVTQAAATVAFHALVMRCTANPVLIALHASLCASTFESMIRARLSTSLSTRVGQVASEVVQALEARDAQGTSEALLTLLELERTWTNSASGRSESEVADAFHRATNVSASVEDFVTRTIISYLPSPVTREVAHA
ncbi:MAG: FadR/GntR family transcriptional regulator [Candidatus Nanopelagicales bacterium]